MGELTMLHPDQSSELASLSPPTIDLVLDSFSASEIERRVVHRVCKVDGARSALRVAGGFRDATKTANHPTEKNREFSQFPLQQQANNNK